MNTGNTQNTWFLQKDNQSIGPLRLEDLITMKQNGKLYDHDYVWSHHLPGWVRVFFVSELKLSGTEQGLNLRRYPRYEVNIECYLSNTAYAYPGKIKSLSQGGALLEIYHPHISLHEQVTLFIKPHNLFPHGLVKPSRVVNRQFIPHQVQFKSRCEYIISFLDQHPLVLPKESDSLNNQGGQLC